MGENAGVVDVGDGWAVTFKIESHNHPSYVEPHQGAATGVGGIVRDILTMGARPIAVLDSLRFGPLDAPDTGRVLPGVVAGIGGYGNCLGLPNIGGEVYFDETYLGNPLVNALCVGVMRADGIKLAKADGPGNLVVLFGARTGGDGIGGASVLASATFDDDKPSRSARACRSATRSPRRCSSSAAWRSSPPTWSSASRTSARPGCRARPPSSPRPAPAAWTSQLDLVPLRDPTLAPEEILMSESQERMMAVVTPERLDEFLAITAKWDVTATVIGTVTDLTPEDEARGGRLRMTWHGETIVDLPPRTAAHEGPVYERPIERPLDQDAVVQVGGTGLPRPRARRPAARHAAALVGVAQPRRQVVGHRPVRPLRHGQHRAGPARGRRAWSASTSRPRRGVARRDRRQRPLHPPRPVRRRAARAGRGLPQRRHHRRPPAGRDQLPELRLARGPRGDVAVRRGRPRPGRRLPDARAPRSPAATSASTTRPARPRSCPPR